jgi:hypothetical protein
MVSATYIIGIGIGLLLSRSRRVQGLVLAVSGGAWFLILTKLGAGVALPPSPVGSSASSRYLASGFVTNVFGSLFNHGLAALEALGGHWVDMLANLAPTGVVGVFTAPAIGIVAVAFGENGVQSYVGPITPSFQNFPIYIFVPIGTVLAIAWLYGRFGGRLARVLMVVASLNILGWAVVWLPQVVPTWLRVSSADARVLNRVASMIPERDGVVASQGIVGDFAGRTNIGDLYPWPPFSVRVSAPTTWFVVAPYAGIETETVAQSMDIIYSLAKNPRAHLVSDTDEIWVFRLSVPEERHSESVSFPRIARSFPAGLFNSPVGTDIVSGPVDTWHLRSNGRAGALLARDYWLEPVGKYSASVRLESSGPVSVQVWNDTTEKLLSQHEYSSTRGVIVCRMDVQIRPSDPPTANSPGELYYGLGPFRVDPVPDFTGNNLEVTVVVPVGTRANVYSVSVNPISSD